MIEVIRERMHSLAETDYKEFNQKLIPGVKTCSGNPPAGAS